MQRRSHHYKHENEENGNLPGLISLPPLWMVKVWRKILRNHGKVVKYTTDKGSVGCRLCNREVIPPFSSPYPKIVRVEMNWDYLRCSKENSTRRRHNAHKQKTLETNNTKSQRVQVIYLAKCFEIRGQQTAAAATHSSAVLTQLSIWQILFIQTVLTLLHDPQPKTAHLPPGMVIHIFWQT